MTEENLHISAQRYQSLFEDSPFPMWEEDFSSVKLYLDELIASGVTDLRARLTACRSHLEECVRRVRILDVNRAACQFYGVETKEELLAGLSGLFDENAYENFREELLALTEHSFYRAEFQTRTCAQKSGGLLPDLSSAPSRTVSMIVSREAAPDDWSSSPSSISPTGRNLKNKSCNRRRWKASAGWPAASLTTSTIC